MDYMFFITFLILFAFIFASHLLFITRPAILSMTGKNKTKKGKKTKKEKTLVEIDYLISKFKLNKNKLDYKELTIMIPLFDSFIITFVAMVIDFIPLPFFVKFIIGFVLLLGLIYAIYEIYGRHLKKKEKES